MTDPHPPLPTHVSVTESAKAPRVADLMKRFCPSVSYRLMDEGKAHLANKLEEMYNIEPMVVRERDQQNKIVTREVKHTFQVYSKLNKQIQAHYDTIFGPRTRKSGEASADESQLLPFGFGAFQIHRQR